MYMKCPKCGRQNPITSPDEEHTCIFCGAIIPPQEIAGQGNSKTKDRIRKYPVGQSQTKPLNRNQSKPRFD
jgi:ribosomal protein S27E